MKHRLVSAAFLILLGILLFFGIWTIRNWKHLVAFPSTLSAYYAKEFCSCYFVLGRTEDQCHRSVKQYIEISGFSIDKTAKRVEVSGLGRTSSAQLVSGRFGCSIESNSN